MYMVPVICNFYIYCIICIFIMSLAMKFYIHRRKIKLLLLHTVCIKYAFLLFPLCKCWIYNFLYLYKNINSDLVFFRLRYHVFIVVLFSQLLVSKTLRINMSHLWHIANLPFLCIYNLNVSQVTYWDAQPYTRRHDCKYYDYYHRNQREGY